MLVFMRALPGRTERAMVAVPPASVTRDNARADQRRRILRATAEIVAERGYNELTVELIVKRARCSYKTYYKHFSGKEECFVALFESAFSTAERTIRQRLDAEPQAWADKVVLAFRTFVELIVADPILARAVIVESPTVGAEITKRYEQATRAFAPLLREGRELNPRGSDLPDTTEDTLAGSVFWAAYEHLIVGEAEDLITYLPVLIELILRSYLGPEEAGRIARAEGDAREPALA